MFLLKLLAKKKINHDLKNLSQWLKPNNLSLNVKKMELIIFHPKRTELDYRVKFGLNGKRFNPISTVKCLGMLLEEHLLWTKQLIWVNSKFNQTIWIFSKFKNLKIVYHSWYCLLSTIWHPTLGTRKLCRSK